MKVSLYELLEKNYSKLLDGTIGLNEFEYNLIKNNSFEKFVGNQDMCSEFIRSIIGEKSRNFVFNKNRSTHIVVTWLLGLSLSFVFKLNEDSNRFYSTYFKQIWLLTTMMHDYGYFRKELKDPNITLENLTKEYNLLTDSYSNDEFSYIRGMSKSDQFKCFFTYTYDEIKNYFNYRQHALRNNDYEKNDHGIIGGIIGFYNYCKSVEKELNYKPMAIHPSITIMQEQKIACFTAASHNIFKSEPITDDEYKRYGLDNLLSTSPIRVNKTNKLLLLLSLVDTIECTKRFSAKENPKAYLQEITTLKKTMIDIDKDGIFVDFKEFFNYLSKERNNSDMVMKIMNHIDCIYSINTWTSFKTKRISSYEIKIEL